jgi:hypothetical protein
MRMGYKLRLRSRVEALDAVFYLVNDDAAMAAVFALHEREEGEAIDTEDLLRVYSDAFCSCVTAWDGVIDDETGEPVPCTPQAKGAVLTTDKAAVITAYLRTLTAAAGNASEPAEPPTSDTAPES